MVQGPDAAGPGRLQHSLERCTIETPSASDGKQSIRRHATAAAGHKRDQRHGTGAHDGCPTPHVRLPGCGASGSLRRTGQQKVSCGTKKSVRTEATARGAYMAGLSKGTAAEAMSMKPQLERRGQGHCRCRPMAIRSPACFCFRRCAAADSANDDRRPFQIPHGTRFSHRRASLNAFGSRERVLSRSRSDHFQSHPSREGRA